MAEETKHLTIAWQDGLRFEGTIPGGALVRVDGDNETAPGPMLTLLAAAAGCTGADVVSILGKMRVSLESFRIDIAGVRREEEPRRYVGIHLTYHLRAAGLDEVRARRAIDLSLEKYCSVMHSLAADMRVTYDLALG